MSRPARPTWSARGRDALQHAMAPQLVAAVESLTRRSVRSFLSGTDHAGATSIEVFVLEPENTAAGLDAAPPLPR